MKQNVFFVSGIDTDAGKSYATGFLARELNKNGKRTITQKFIQTGNVGYSEDIDLHRRIMGIPHTEEDREGLTMPEIFSYPASPHLASQLDKRPINFNKMEQATAELSHRYDIVLLEGAGGLMVPNDFNSLTIDYVKKQNYPVLLVTSGKLGSIDHTLLSLFACKQYGVEVKALVYNLYPETDKLIADNTMEYLTQYLEKEFPGTAFICLPEYKEEMNINDISITELL